jgi:DNA mismatch repair protein MutL
MKGQFPLGVLFISVPYDQVDVNVHPTKSQVKFAEQNTIHAMVKHAVSEALKASNRPTWSIPSKPAEQIPPVHWGSSNISETRSAFRVPGPMFDGMANQPPRMHSEQRTREAEHEFQIENRKSKIENLQPLFWGKKPFGDLKIIGQLHQTFILCESPEGLILVDQHAAHERIRFEQLRAISNRSKKEAQYLFLSETIEVSHSEADILKNLIPNLKETGLDIEPFGGNTFVVKSIPALLEGRNIRSIILEMVEKAAEVGITRNLEQALEQCLVVMACHDTVRANQTLTETEMKALLQQLDECDTPSHCPHGRPIWIAWSRKTLEKYFHRTA